MDADAILLRSLTLHEIAGKCGCNCGCCEPKNLDVAAEIAVVDQFLKPCFRIVELYEGFDVVNML